MFTRLEFKVRALIVIVVSTSAVVTSLLLFLTLRENILRHAVRLSIQYAEQQNRNAQLFLSLMEETAKLLLNDEDIIQALQNPGFNSSIANKAIDKLNGIQNSSVNLTSITIYGLNRAQALYSSDSIELAPNNRPTLGQLLQNRSLRDFTLSDGQLLWWTHIQKSGRYRTRPARTLGSFLTLALKINDANHQPIGYVLLDMKTSSFFPFFEDKKGYNGAYIIGGSQKLIPASYNRNLHYQMIRRWPSKNDPDHYLVDGSAQFLYIGFPIAYSSDRIVKVITLAPVKRQLFVFALALMVLNGGIIIGALWISQIISASIALPLNELLIKLQKTA